MISVTINLDTSRFDRMMSDFPVRMAAAKRRALAAIGTEVTSRTTLAFRTASMRPAPWAPRKPSKRDDGHPLLIRSGGLQKNFRSEVTGHDTVVVGTMVEYARYHQFGTKKMPARPFFPFDKAGRIVPAMERKIKGILERVCREELGKLVR